MQKSKFFKDFTDSEISTGYAVMCSELMILPKDHVIRLLFATAWTEFKMNQWSTDGATFVNERFPHCLFELAAFIHDWRNSKGYVGSAIDREFICIMIALNYKPELIFKRRAWMRLTFINVIRHRILKNLQEQQPKNLFQL